MRPPVKIQADVGAVFPERQTKGSVGYDLAIPNVALTKVVKQNDAFLDAVIQDSKIIMPSESAVFIDTLLRMAIPEGVEGQIRSRSGLGNKGIVVTQGVGTIDSDYRGPVKVGLHNASPDTVVLRPGDRVAQIVFAQVYLGTENVEFLDDSERGDAGFGSTGT